MVSTDDAVLADDTALTAEIVRPALRGAYGREYYHAVETPTTQRMLPETAAHGAVALAEHQTEGRGRLGRTWVDEPGLEDAVLGLGRLGQRAEQ